MNDIKLPAVMEVENSIGAFIKRRVIFINSNGSCLAIKGDSREDTETPYVNLKPEMTSYFKSCREIKEPTWRPFERNEDLEPFIDCWFRMKRDEAYYLYKPIGYSSRTGIMFMDDESEELFWLMADTVLKSWEMKVDGKWQPVGVLEQ